MENNHSQKDTLLPTGADRGLNPSKARTNNDPKLAIAGYNQLKIDADKWEKFNEGTTWDDVANAFNIDRQQIHSEWTEESHLIVITYSNPLHLKHALEDIPGLKASIYSNRLEMDMRPQQDNNKTVKIRQCPIDTDISKLMILNDLVGWKGKLWIPKENKKRTTAILTAPTEADALKLLERNYLVDNGRVLSIVPGNYYLQDEDARTVLLVGVNKVNDALRKAGSSLTELALLMTLMQHHYPVQALNFAELERGKIGHSAFVRIKKPEQISNLQPFKDIASGATLKWTCLENHKKICNNCLSWEGHEQWCFKHDSHKHSFASAEETTKRAIEKEQIYLERFKRPKEKPR